MTVISTRKHSAPDPFADRREAPRVAVALAGFMTFDGKRRSVQLLDVSAGGAKLTCPDEVPAMGATIDLDCGTVRRVATVRWTGGATAGVSFDCNLDDREQAALVERSNALDQRMNPLR